MQGILDLSLARGVYESIVPKNRDGSVSVESLRQVVAVFLISHNESKYRQHNRQMNPALNKQVEQMVNQVIGSTI